MNTISNASTARLFQKLGLRDLNPGVFGGEWIGHGSVLKSVSPIDGNLLARVRTASQKDYECVVSRAQEAFCQWRDVPAPKRGEVLRQLGHALRAAKKNLARLVTLETGKI